MSRTHQPQRHSFAQGEWGGEWHPDFAHRRATSCSKSTGVKAGSQRRTWMSN
jgi:hypothetical protein